jgi:hypothetical protein
MKDTDMILTEMQFKLFSSLLDYVNSSDKIEVLNSDFRYKHTFKG